jgi:uncharacterized membrane protein
MVSQALGRRTAGASIGKEKQMTAMLSRTDSKEYRHCAIAVTLFAGMAALSACSPASEAAGSDEKAGAGTEQVFHIATLHLDGKTNIKGAGDHSPEPFPATASKSSGGFIVKPPNPEGEWSVRAFAFHPSQVVVRQGDTVVLNFLGVQGPSHKIAVDGQPEQLALRRGEMKSVRFVADKPGVVRFVSKGREPNMQGSVVVLPRAGS